jgi:lipid II:glycine glycyltransferase (peptidoglycan interpeptide bridge formation enzyme)
MRWTDKMEDKNHTEISYREFYEKLDNIHKDITEIKIQTTKTNGRVTSCEANITKQAEQLKELSECNKNQDKEINKLIWKVSLIVAFLSFVVYKLTGFLISL